MTVARRPADMATVAATATCRTQRSPSDPRGVGLRVDSAGTRADGTAVRSHPHHRKDDTYHLSETGLIATLAVVYGLTSWPHVQTAQQSGSTPTTARKPKSSKDIIGLADAPSDDLRPSSEDTRRIAVIIAEAHRGVPDDGAFIKNVANVGKKGSRRPLERIYPFWLGCPSPISSARC